MTIVPVAILDDNYAYLVIDTVSNLAVAVDPSDAEAVKVNTGSVLLQYILMCYRVYSCCSEKCSAEECHFESSSHDSQTLVWQPSPEQLAYWPHSQSIVMVWKQ